MTTDTPTTRAIAEQFLERLGRQDQDAVQELFAADIDWYVPGSDTLPWTGHRIRREEVAPYFTTMWPRFVPGESDVTLEKLLIDGGDAIVLATFGHTVVDTGRRYTTPVAMHLGIEDGEIVRMHLYEDTLVVAEAFAAA